MFNKFFLPATILAGAVTSSPIAMANDSGNGAPSEPERLYENWEFAIGAGVMYAPDYMGSDDYDAGFMPHLEVVWNDRVSLSMGGLLVDAYKTDNLTLGLGVGMTEGRDESDNQALRGLGDIDSSAAAVLYANYQWEMMDFGARFEQDLGDGHEGALVGLEANFMVPVVEDKLMFMVGPDATWVSEDYMQSFYGISSKQAANSAYSRYDVDSGFRDVGLHAMIEYRITDSVSFNVVSQYSRIIGDAADSPIVKDKGSENQLSSGMMIKYEF
ncbi:MipA/OmpV family protein [Curvivirga aplysinae]|uniref:MipA/OmpV family protein n=1 Tax=Curvivirga aplysinae TaxID=2529852 RepID=UPI0012BC9E69|nr:MipA/OmpV family protein [Curvivirga aplysinae]MTI08559.1 MipA/OmpV family protein [Curvivirga aplysinae]